MPMMMPTIIKAPSTTERLARGAPDFSGVMGKVLNAARYLLSFRGAAQAASPESSGKIQCSYLDSGFAAMQPSLRRLRKLASAGRVAE
jgi:hypothetical protein